MHCTDSQTPDCRRASGACRTRHAGTARGSLLLTGADKYAGGSRERSTLARQRALPLRQPQVQASACTQISAADLRVARVTGTRAGTGGLLPVRAGKSARTPPHWGHTLRLAALLPAGFCRVGVNAEQGRRARVAPAPMLSLPVPLSSSLSLSLSRYVPGVVSGFVGPGIRNKHKMESALGDLEE